MSGKIEISRELLARTYWELDAGTPSIATLAELQALLAAPVVERQEPVAVVLTMKDVMAAVCLVHHFPMLTTNQCHALAAALNKVKELNQ